MIGEADYLYSSIQLLCWVMLNGDGEHINVWPFSPSADSARKTIGQTWGKRCAKTIFYTNSQDGDSEAIHLNTHNLNSWEALHEVVSHTAKDGDIERYDWFLKVEEDTFLIVENLLYYLSVYNSSLPHYFGNPYQKWGSTYNAGGPGYVLSRTALRKLHNQLVKGHCPKSGSTEDLTLGSCLEEIGVAPQDTRDALGRARFLMYQPESLLVPGNLPWSEKIWAQAKFPSGEVSSEQRTADYLACRALYTQGRT